MIEIIAMTVEDARRIEDSGADRIELVSALSEGGLTPSYELIKNVVNEVKIPVNVIIRPHSKSFVYKKTEVNGMVRDIKKAKELGANGVVLGALNKEGKIDKAVLEKLIAASEGLDITFHRAIDELKSPSDGVYALARYKEIKTILTSGGLGRLTDNLECINEMRNNAAHIEVMIGGGLNFENLEQILRLTKTNWFHFGRAVRVGNSVDGDIDENAIKKAIQIINFDQEKLKKSDIGNWR